MPDNISKISLEIMYKVCDTFCMSFIKIKHRNIKSLKSPTYYFECRKKFHVYIKLIKIYKINILYLLTFVEKASSHSVQKRFSSFTCSSIWDLRLAILVYFLPHSGHFGSPILCVAIWSVKFVCNDAIVQSY